MINERVQLIEGASRRWRITVQTQEGAPVDLSDYDFYGGAASRSRRATLPMALVSATSVEVVLELPPLPYGEWWHHQIYMRETATGVERVLLTGRIEVLERLGEAAEEGTRCEVSSLLVYTMADTAEPITGQLVQAGPMGPMGPQGEEGKSAYELAVAGGYAGSEEAWIAELNGVHEAAAQVAGSAKKAENNTFTGINTFNGSLVANSGITLGSQPLEKLLAAPSALELMAAGWNPLSGEAETFAEWEAMNPDWKKREHLVLYAPKITGSLPSLTERNAVKSGLLVTSGGLPSVSSGNASKNFGVADLCWLTYATFLYGGVNVYECGRLHVYAPNATSVNDTMCFGYLNNLSKVGMDVVLWLPKVQKIGQIGSNCIFANWGPIAALKCYMPQVVTGFRIGATGYTCDVLRSLVEGLGTPASLENISIKAPLDGAEVADAATGQTKFEALQAFAATKNWNFVEKT